MMTREEAIEILEEELQFPSKPDLVRKHHPFPEAIKVALTALRGSTKEMVDRMRSERIEAHDENLGLFLRRNEKSEFPVRLRELRAVQWEIEYSDLSPIDERFNVSAQAYAVLRCRALGGLQCTGRDGESDSYAAVVLDNLSEDGLVIVRVQVIFGPLSGGIIRQGDNFLPANPAVKPSGYSIPGGRAARTMDEKLPGPLLVQSLNESGKISDVRDIFP